MATLKNKCRKLNEVLPTHLMHIRVDYNLSPWVNIVETTVAKI
jgi:hypothetical protein